MQFREAAPPRRRMSLTPLIDVVFLLLVFFMLSSSFIQWRQVDLQAGASEAAPEVLDDKDTDWLSVHIRSCSFDDVTVNGSKTAMAQLSTVLKDQAKPESKARLTSENTVPLACVIRVLDEIEAANITATTVEGLIK